MKWLAIFLLVPLLCFGQWKFKEPLFTATLDTINSITSKDTIEARLGVDDLWGPWKQLTETNNDTADITPTDKTTETTKVYELADEAWWTFAPKLEVRIRNSEGTGDTITTVHTIGQLEGAVTLFVKPDTTGTDTFYSGSVIGGR